MQNHHTAPAATPVQNNMRDRRPAPSPYGGNFLLTPSLQEYLVPDLTLPEQYFGRQQCDDGMGAEKALMYAVLKDGIRCYYKNVGATRRKYVKMFTEAEEWLIEDTFEDPFAFRAICDTLGIDADCLRSRLVAWKDAELTRRELTGDTSSVQVGRSPFPTPVDLDKLDAASTDAYQEEGEDEWEEPPHISLEDLSHSDALVRAA